MGKRVVLAGLLGGLGMFVWSAMAHMVLPLGEAGVREIPNEQALLGSMHTTLGEKSGMYLFPAMGVESGQKASMQEYDQKLATAPSGMLIYHQPGARLMMPKWLTTEFLTEAFEAILAAFLLAQVRVSSFARRAAFVSMIGVIAAVATNIPYWNWYGFPGVYTTAYMTTQIIGFVIAGCIAAAMIKPAPYAAGVGA